MRDTKSPRNLENYNGRYSDSAQNVSQPVLQHKTQRMDKRGHPVLSTRTQLSSRPSSLHTYNRGLYTRPKQLKHQAKPALIKKEVEKTALKSQQGANKLII